MSYSLSVMVALRIASHSKKELVPQSGSNHERKMDDWHVSDELHGIMESRKTKKWQERHLLKCLSKGSVVQ